MQKVAEAPNQSTQDISSSSGPLVLNQIQFATHHILLLSGLLFISSFEFAGSITVASI
jgi:hypothetical protein